MHTEHEHLVQNNTPQNQEIVIGKNEEFVSRQPGQTIYIPGTNSFSLNQNYLVNGVLIRSSSSVRNTPGTITINGININEYKIGHHIPNTNI